MKNKNVSQRIKAAHKRISACDAETGCAFASAFLDVSQYLQVGVEHFSSAEAAIVARAFEFAAAAVEKESRR